MTPNKIRPKVSVMTPCYNSEVYLEMTIQSVLDQSMPEFEFIVVDDGSTDGSAGVADLAAQRDDRIRVEKQPNQGVSSARQNGYRLSDPKSLYLVFLDADDLIDVDFLQVLSEHLDRHPDVATAYSSRRDIDGQGGLLPDNKTESKRFRRVGRRIAPIPESEPDTPLESIMSYFDSYPSQTMFRRSAFARTLGWRTVGVVEDKDMSIQMALVGKVHFVPQSVMSYRHHDEQRHVDRVQGSLKLLHQRWWNEPTIEYADLIRVRQAIAFDRRVTGLNFRKQCWIHLRRHEFALAFTSAKRALACSIRWLTMNLRIKAGSESTSP